MDSEGRCEAVIRLLDAVFGGLIVVDESGVGVLLQSDDGGEPARCGC